MVLEDIKGKPYYFTNHDLKRFILPVIIEQFLALLVGMSDSIMVATVGEHAVLFWCDYRVYTDPASCDWL